MPLFIYECKKCENTFEELFTLSDGKFKDMETGKILGEDPPLFRKCPDCNRKSLQVLVAPSVRIKGDCAENRRREKDFLINGYNKQQATRFYQESIEASKERMKSGGQHYKKVDPNLKELSDAGIARPVSDQRRAEKIESAKQIGRKLKDTTKVIK